MKHGDSMPWALKKNVGMERKVKSACFQKEKTNLSVRAVREIQFLNFSVNYGIIRYEVQH